MPTAPRDIHIRPLVPLPATDYKDFAGVLFVSRQPPDISRSLAERRQQMVKERIDNTKLVRFLLADYTMEEWDDVTTTLMPDVRSGRLPLCDIPYRLRTPELCLRAVLNNPLAMDHVPAVMRDLVYDLSCGIWNVSSP